MSSADTSGIANEFADSSSSSITRPPTSMLSLTLAIQGAGGLEQRFWLRRCRNRLTSLDVLYELCNTLVWLAILPGLQAGRDRTYGKASLLLGVMQLAAIHLTPQLWLRRRTLFLSSGMLLRCSMLALHLQACAQPPQQLAAGAAAADGSTASSMVVAVGFWGNLLFVLFHQQPVRLQVPLLTLSSLLQVGCTLSSWQASSGSGGSSSSSTVGGSCSSAAPGSGPTSSSGGSNGSDGWLLQHLGQGGAAAELPGLSEALARGMQQLLAGLFGGLTPPAGLLLPPPSLLRPHDAVDGGDGAEAPALLATRLFLVVFGGFVVPCFLAYVMEWRWKVAYLLAVCKGPQSRLDVLTPAAAVVRSSALLAALLYGGWLLMLAVACWLLCSAGVSAVLAAAGPWSS